MVKRIFFHAPFILQKQKEQSAELDTEIAEKRDRLNAENGNAIKSGVANLFGKGKYADMEKEDKRLKEELPKQKVVIQRKYQQVGCQPSQNCYEVLLRLFSIMFSLVIAVSHIARSAMSSVI